MQAMGQDRYDLLLHCDQLNIEKTLGNIPKYFKEGDIAFAPTFKRKPYNNTQFGLKRNPAWTDRILYYSNEETTDLQLKSYDSNNLVNFSDHRPVFAQFLLSIDLQDNQSDAEGGGLLSAAAPVDDAKSVASKKSSKSVQSSASRISRKKTKTMSE